MSLEKVIHEGLYTGPAGDDCAGTATATRSGRVDVIHGVYAHSLPLAGMTVRQARTELEERPSPAQLVSRVHAALAHAQG